MGRMETDKFAYGQAITDISLDLSRGIYVQSNTWNLGDVHTYAQTVAEVIKKNMIVWRSYKER